jgi:3-oxoadipate CoA-transferase, alpha subunit
VRDECTVVRIANNYSKGVDADSAVHRRCREPGVIGFAGRNKIADSIEAAIGQVPDAATVLVGGWGRIGIPDQLIPHVVAAARPGLTVVSNNCGVGKPGDIGELFAAGVVSKAIATYPVHQAATAFRERYDSGEVELEVVPQGTLAERLRAGGAGIGGFFTPTGAGTELAGTRETRVIDGREHVYESALRGDLAIIRAAQADAAGNLRFRYASRAFSPLMAMAAKRTVVQADEIVPVNAMAPDDIHLPGIFVDAVVLGGTR